MKMTLPCSAHQSKRERDWYKKSEPTMPRLCYAVHERRQLAARESYARHLAERRRKEHYLLAVLRPLANEDLIFLESAGVVADERSLEQRFREQADKWERETQHLSS